MLDPDSGCPECGTIGRDHAPDCTYEPLCDHESPHCPHAERVTVPLVPLVHRLADERLKRGDGMSAASDRRPGTQLCHTCGTALTPYNTAYCDYHDQTCDECDTTILTHPHGRTA